MWRSIHPFLLLHLSAVRSPDLPLPKSFQHLLEDPKVLLMSKPIQVAHLNFKAQQLSSGSLSP